MIKMIHKYHTLTYKKLRQVSIKWAFEVRFDILTLRHGKGRYNRRPFCVATFRVFALWATVSTAQPFCRVATFPLLGELPPLSAKSASI